MNFLLVQRIYKNSIILLVKSAYAEKKELTNYATEPIYDFKKHFAIAEVIDT